jgi:leader peptidase (prepilin peptidase) / N-methyltransferase
MAGMRAVDAAWRRAAFSIALIVAVAASLLVADGPEGFLGALLAALMLAIAIMDGTRYIIPDELTATAMGLALLRAGTIGTEADWRAVAGAALRAAAVALPFFALMIGYRRWRGRDGIGLGDVKLAAVAGAWLNLVTVFAAIELATLSALGTYVVIGAINKRPLKVNAFLPFGAFLAPAIWIGWLVETLLS